MSTSQDYQKKLEALFDKEERVYKYDNIVKASEGLQTLNEKGCAQFPDIDGNLVEEKRDITNKKWHLEYKSYQEIAQEATRKGTTKGVLAFTQATLTVDANDPEFVAQEQRKKTWAEDYGSDFLDYEGTWQEMKIDKELKKAVEDWKSSKKADKMICFGLGTLIYPKEYGLHAWNQHMAAFTLAKLLGIKQLYFQDPLYHDKDKDYIKREGNKEEWNVEFCNDPEGLLLIDSKTIIVDIGAEIPLRQMVANIALEKDRRPAGMLWARVPEAGEPEEGGSLKCASSPLVLQLVENYYDRKDIEKDEHLYGGTLALYLRKT